jgi:DHA1 family chloramphenicol resistance protein-like MFS transporter
MSVLAGGLTVATILGLAAGTVIGQHLGWRAAFWAVAGLSALSAIGVLATIPGGRPKTEGAPSVTTELRAIARPRLWLAYGVTALTTGALLATFSYLSPLLTGVTGIDEPWVPAVLALYGAGSLIGITIGGRIGDARPFPLLFTGVVGLVLTSAALALSAEVAVLAIPLIFLLGAFGFGTNPALNARPFALAKNAPTLAAAFNVAAFNVGITVGPWVGGLMISADLGYASVAWTGVAIGVVALAAAALSAALERGGNPLRKTHEVEIRSAA